MLNPFPIDFNVVVACKRCRDANHLKIKINAEWAADNAHDINFFAFRFGFSTQTLKRIAERCVVTSMHEFTVWITLRWYLDGRWVKNEFCMCLIKKWKRSIERDRVRERKMKLQKMLCWLSILVTDRVRTASVHILWKTFFGAIFNK